MNSKSATKTILLTLFYLRSSSIVRNVALALVGSVLIAVSAQIRVPIWPVPFTMQTFAVILIGMIYGSRLGLLTLITYLFEGIVGLPVFSGFASGFQTLIGPTGGYLIGFLLAAVSVGWLSERGWNKGIFRILAAIILGNILIFLPGVLWLGNVVGFEKALQLGLYPFWLGFLIKTFLAVSLLLIYYKFTSETAN